MNKFIEISASILNANLAALGEECGAVLEASADSIHFDVMDNHYVPNLTFGPSVCTSLRKFGINAPIDVHLMTRPVDRLISSFAEAGATSITIHPEATDHLDRSLQLIIDSGCKVGVALNPATSSLVLEEIMYKIDIVLVMSVNPGFGGQKFIESSIKKVEKIKHMIESTSKARTIKIIVDGGVNANNAAKIAKAGADILIVGAYIFNEKSGSYKTKIEEIKKRL